MGTRPTSSTQQNGPFPRNDVIRRLRRTGYKDANQSTYGVFSTKCLLKSGLPSSHQTGLLSQRAILALSTWLLASIVATLSRLASRTARLADMSSLTSRSRSPAGRAGSLFRQRAATNDEVSTVGCVGVVLSIIRLSRHLILRCHAPSA